MRPLQWSPWPDIINATTRTPKPTSIHMHPYSLLTSLMNRVKELRLGYFYLWRDSSVTSAWRSQTAQTPTCTTSHLSFLFHLPCSNINVIKHHKSRTYNYPNASITLHFEFIHCHRNQCLLTLHCIDNNLHENSKILNCVI